MKKVLGLFCLTIIAVNVNAKIWRVNNRSGVVADFNNLQTAISSAATGDTLHIEPSNTDYGAGSLDRRLVIIGSGYFLDPANGGNAGLQWNTLESTANYINFNNGSNGSKLIGMKMPYGVQFYMNSGGSANITIEKCYLGGILLGQTFTFNNIVFRKCFFKQGGLGQIFYLQGAPTVTNLIFENNIVENKNLEFSIIGSGTNIVRNNVFTNCTSSSLFGATYFANNIVVNSSDLNLLSCTVKNNIFSSTTQIYPGSFPNQTGVAASTIFILTGSNDAKYQLKGSSPAIGYGVTISGYTPDCGAYGATDPYKLSGIPDIPSIYSLTVPGTVNLGDNMPLIFSTRNNN